MLTLDIQVCLFAFSPRIFIFTPFLLIFVNPLCNSKTFNYIEIKIGIRTHVSIPK